MAVARRFPLLPPLLTGVLLRTVRWCLVEPVPVSDGQIYHDGALSFAAGRGFSFADGEPNGYWPPGYSWFLSLFEPLTGGSFAGWFAPNLLLAASLILTQAALAQACFGRRAGVAAAWMAACLPSWILLPTTGLSENLFLVLVTGFAALAVGSWRTGTAVTLLGTLLGAAILTRPTALVLPAIHVGAAWCARVPVRKGLAQVACATALGLLMCVPWGLRQQRMFGEFSLSSFNGGPVLWMGNHDGPPTTNIPERFRDLGVVERHRAMQAEAIEFIRAHPGTYVRRVGERAATALRSETFAVWWNGPAIRARFGEGGIRLAGLVCSAGWYAVAAAALAAAWLRIRSGCAGRVDAWIAAALLLQSLPFLLLDSQNRYHAPLVPFLAAWASWLWSGWRQDSSGQPRSS